MKKFILSAAILATLASCNYNNTIATNYEAIQFGNAFVDNNVRATDPSYGAENPLNSFQVWGTVNGADNNPVAIFADDTVTGTVGANSIWSCTTNTQYWIVGAKYNFAAVVNADKKVDGKSSVTPGTDLLPATIAYTADGSTDLLYAKSIEYTGQTAGNNSKVAFTFEHLLSKVLIKVTNDSKNVSGYSFEVKNIKINAPKTNGSYNVAGKQWTATKGDYSFANIVVAQNADAECDAEQLLIPGEATITFDVDIMVDGSDITTKNYTHTTTLAAAHAYSFNIIVSTGEKIDFTVENHPTWTVEDQVTIQ